ncbi:MAG: type II toxin-antitoxin system PemK/MazF family toxin, partial [Gemmataceae bacterium]
MPSQGDIVLVPVPFTDLSSTRRRPVIVVSNDGYNRSTTDMVVVATSFAGSRRASCGPKKMWANLTPYGRGS